ncbi:uncharacterized protein J2S78_000874 [Salibacterium salarium]|uniref:DUF418 domain-containing protein n=1 Tax=Salibacterium salarium TaxID=284579 RepID=UPI0027881E6B|nr:DUF418 domain-containing protein [Salibacterium salarium]MDQ0298466.1 uncharacterized protein [Salibacterium salarium]
MVNHKHRLDFIDALRGWALFGILIANLLIFQYGIWGKDNISYFPLSSNDMYSYYFVKIFVEFSFMPIFTFIFGYGLILMKNSLQRNELRVKSHMFRRFIVLIVFGLLHSIFLWEGDILFVYGCMGLFLLIFVHRKPKTLLIWGLSLFIIFAAVSVFGAGDDSNVISESETTSYLDETLKVYSTGTYSDIKYHRNNVDPLDLHPGEAVFTLLLTPFFISPMFLFGMYAAHKKWLHHPFYMKKQFKAGVLTLIPIGLLLKSLPYLFHSMNSIDTSMVGGNVLSFGYICLFALMYITFHANYWFHPFKNIGKLSLTNYIAQTIICTSIFYGYGLGMFGQISVTASILLGMIIFSLQAVGSTIYLKYFNQGPLEKLTKICVYMKRHSFRKKNTMKAS